MALDFVVTGAQRAGTTWLFTRLSMHPRIYFPLGKEINFWNNFADFEASNRFMIKLYMRRFAEGSMAAEDHLKRGDICPQYSIMDEFSIGKLYSRFPKAAIIYVLRNPILRAYSARRFTVTRGKKGPEFLEPERVASLFSERSSLPQGNYAGNIRRWSKVAEAHGLLPPHIVFYDDILSDPVGFLRKLCRVIGIDEDFYGQIPEQVVAERVNSARDTAFPAEVYPQALSHYRPMILELQDLTGEDLSGWLNEDAPSEFRAAAAG